MRIFVTGTSGFLGKWTAERLLREGHTIKGYDLVANPYQDLAPHCVIGNILDADRLNVEVEKFKPDGIIHLAARCDLNGDELAAYDANITGVRNICCAARKSPSVTRTIYTSSQLVCKVGHIPDDDYEYCPDTIYGQSKVLTEEIVREEDGGKVEWCIVRPTTVWGPYMGQHYQSLLRHIRKGTYFHTGSGRLTKSYAYAENIGYQYYMLLTAAKEKVEKQVFYLADYKPISLRDYTNGLAKAMNTKQPVTLPLIAARVLALAGDALNAAGLAFPFNSFRLRNILTEYVFDMQKTQAVCGELPVSFEDGIKETAEWFMARE